MPKNPRNMPHEASLHRGILSRTPDGEPATLSLAQAAVNNEAG